MIYLKLYKSIFLKLKMYTVKKKVVLKQYNWHFLVLLIFCLEVSVDFKRISIFNAAEGEAVAVEQS